MHDSTGIKVAALTGISRNAGGLFYAVSSLYKALSLQGAQVSVYGRSDPYVENDRAVWDPVPVIPYKAWGPLRSSLTIRRMLLEANPDLTHQHGLWLDDQWAALHWHNKTGKPMVISAHGMLDPWALRNSAWKKKLAGWLFVNESLKNAACLHALCESEADSIRRLGLKNPIAVIPNGIDLPELADAGKEDRGRKRLLFLGRIHPKKGLIELLSAWAGLQERKTLSEWQLLIAGWDDRDHLKALRAHADELGLKWSDTQGGGLLGEDGSDALPAVKDCSVFFLGPVFGQDKDRILRHVDGFILPSFSEGLPMSVLEAWSYALPVMMTAFCNIPEGFDADAAIKIEPEVESIKRGLEQWAAMKSTDLVAMGGRGRALVARKFTWEGIAQDMKVVYDGCLAGEKVSF